MNTYTLLVNLTLKSTAVLALAWLVTLALRRHSAAARHIVWTAAFATLLALPLLSLSLPSWTHPFANLLLPADSGVTFRTSATAAVAHAGAARPLPSTPAPTAVAPRIDPRQLIAAAWSFGAAFALLHMLMAYGSAWRLRRTSLPSPHDPAAFGIAEPVELLEIAEGMPMTAGVFRPAIFLPAESVDWSRERLRIVVAHEYAHVRRGDAAAQLLARAALCLQWFNPLAWMAWRALLNERERAADDLVLAAGAHATDYAGHLLEIARTLQASPSGASAGIAMARRSQLEGRLVAILDSRVKRSNPGRAVVAVAVLAALAVALPLATVRAQSKVDQGVPPDVEQVIAQANAQKNHDLLDQTAVAYEKLRKFSEAQKLRDAALAIRKDAGKVQYAEGLVRLGDLALKRGAADEAMSFYQQAVALGDMPETASALLSLGLDAAFRGKNIPLAIEYLERARNAARAGNEIGRAMTWLAFLQQEDILRANELESMYRTALSLEDPGSAERAFSSELLARFLRKQERTSEAESLEQSALAMRKVLAAQVSASGQEAFSRIAINGVMKVGSGVKPPQLIYKLEPSYTEEARALKLQGTVLLKLVVDVDGRAKDVQVVKGVGLGLDEKAVEAVVAWKFKPGEAGGVAVPVQAQIEINFRLL